MFVGSSNASSKELVNMADAHWMIFVTSQDFLSGCCGDTYTKHTVKKCSLHIQKIKWRAGVEVSSLLEFS